MAQQTPSSRNRSRKPSYLSGPVIAGGVLGLFLVSFLVGLFVLPSLSKKQAIPVQAEGPPGVEVAELPSPPDRSKISVRELPGDPPAQPVLNATRNDREENEVRERREERRERRRPRRKKSEDETRRPSAASQERPRSETPKASSEDKSSETETPSHSEDSETPEPSNYRIQAGAYENEENARKMADQLAGSGYQPSVTTTKTSEKTMYRVQVGPFKEKKAAEDAVRDLGGQGISARVADEAEDE